MNDLVEHQLAKAESVLNKGGMPDPDRASQ